MALQKIPVGVGLPIADGVKFINDAIDAAGRSESKSDEAAYIANEAKQKAESTKTEFDQVVIEGDSSVEAAQARVDISGNAYDTLKARLDEEYVTVTNKLGDVSDDLKKSDLFDKLYGSLNFYSKPIGFTLDIPFNIQTSLSGKATYDFDIATNKNSVSKRYYVDIETGENSNPGTESQPFKSIHRALRYGDAQEIIVKPGIYGWSDAYNAYRQDTNYNLIGEGEVYVGAHRDGLTWTLHETYNNVYQTNASSVYEIVDMKNFEQPKFLELQTDIQSVNETPNSYYIDSNNNIYIRTYDNRKPDNFVLCNLEANAAHALNVDKIYFENIKFTNTVEIATTSNSNSAFYAKNCHFYFGANSNSLYLKGVDFILQNCKAKYASRDGFNYHVSNGILSNGIELDCEGAYNGRDGADQNNGSTMHDGGSILRIKGEYHHNHGPNVIDVNEGTKSLNIGVHAHHSTAINDISNSDFKNGNVGISDMWLVNCVSHDSNYSIVTAGGGTTTKDNSLMLSPTTVL